MTNWLELRDLSTSNEVIASDSPKECYPPTRLVNPVGGFLGHFGVALMTAFAHSPSLTSDFCRPFAAHCIGYPTVMLGFGLKTYFRSVFVIMFLETINFVLNFSLFVMQNLIVC